MQTRKQIRRLQQFLYQSPWPILDPPLSFMKIDKSVVAFSARQWAIYFDRSSLWEYFVPALQSHPTAVIHRQLAEFEKVGRAAAPKPWRNGHAEHNVFQPGTVSCRMPERHQSRARVTVTWEARHVIYNTWCTIFIFNIGSYMQLSHWHSQL